MLDSRHISAVKKVSGQVRTELYLALHVQCVHRLAYRGPSKAPMPLLTSSAARVLPQLILPPAGSSTQIPARRVAAPRTVMVPFPSLGIRHLDQTNHK